MYICIIYVLLYDIVEAPCNVVTTSTLIVMSIYMHAVLYTIEEGLHGQNILQSVAILLRTYLLIKVSSLVLLYVGTYVRTY